MASRFCEFQAAIQSAANSLALSSEDIGALYTPFCVQLTSDQGAWTSDLRSGSAAQANAIRIHLTMKGTLVESMPLEFVSWIVPLVAPAGTLALTSVSEESETSRSSRRGNLKHTRKQPVQS